MENLIVEYFHWRDSLPITERLIVDFLIGTVLIRGILGKRATRLVEYLGALIRRPVVRFLKAVFIKTEADLAVWIHYLNQTLDEGHSHETPIDCEDGSCKLI